MQCSSIDCPAQCIHMACYKGVLEELNGKMNKLPVEYWSADCYEWTKNFCQCKICKSGTYRVELFTRRKDKHLDVKRVQLIDENFVPKLLRRRLLSFINGRNESISLSFNQTKLSQVELFCDTHELSCVEDAPGEYVISKRCVVDFEFEKRFMTLNEVKELQQGLQNQNKIAASHASFF